MTLDCPKRRASPARQACLALPALRKLFGVDPQQTPRFENLQQAFQFFNQLSWDD